MTSLEELAARVAAIEARQRLQGIHDAWCPILRVRNALYMPVVIAEPIVCSCWLSTEQGE